MEFNAILFGGPDDGKLVKIMAYAPYHSIVNRTNGETNIYAFDSYNVKLRMYQYTYLRRKDDEGQD